MAKTEQDVPVSDEALAKIPQTSTEVGAADEMSDAFEQDSGDGMQGMGANDFAIPFISILQKGSPQVDDLSPKFIEGARAGMFMNTVTGVLYSADIGILVVPCAYKKMMVEWKHRDSGGGLIAQHPENTPLIKTCTQNEKSQFVLPNGHLLIDTAYHYVLQIIDGFPTWAVISMTSTQLKKSRMWNTVMRNILVDGKNGKYNPPTYSHAYRITAVGETKDKYSWYGYKIELDQDFGNKGRMTGKEMPIYDLAKKFAEAANRGAVRMSQPPAGGEESADGDSIPF